MTGSIEAQVLQPYKYGFVTDIEADVIPPGLNEDVIRVISQKKGEPPWMLEWRLRAYRQWLKMTEPHWSNVTYGPIDYQAISYYAAPKAKPRLDSLEQVDPKLIETFEKLGIPLEERKRLAGVAVDAVFDRPVRAHVDRGGRGELRELPRRLLRPGAGREPAARRRGRARGAGQRADQVLDHPELVPGGRSGAWRHLQLRDQAG